MGLCAQLFEKKYAKEENNNTGTILQNKNILPEAISVNLNIPSEVNVNLHVYIHTEDKINNY